MAATVSSKPTAAEIATRSAGIIALGGVAYVHIIGVSDKLEEVKYLGVGYIGLIAGCAISALVLAFGNRALIRKTWIAAAAMCAAMIIGFILTRTTGLPQSSDDIGNWSEPEGIWALAAAGAVIVTAGAALRSSRPDIDD